MMAESLLFHSNRLNPRVVGTMRRLAICQSMPREAGSNLNLDRHAISILLRTDYPV